MPIAASKLHRIIQTTIIITAVAAIFSGLWAVTSRPISEPDWPDHVSGWSFSPMRLDNNPNENRFPKPEQIAEDMRLLAESSNAIRTYTLQGTLTEVPRLAQAYGLEVTLGAWINADVAANEREIEKLIDLANRYQSVVRVVVGNEVLLRGDITPEQLIAYIDRVRARVKVPVTTAEPWHVWQKYPELADHVDLIGAHILPYWEGLSAAESVNYAVMRMDELQKLFPKKHILLAEVGWPSEGRSRREAVASTTEQALFLRRFLQEANDRGYEYFIMEAFDQPWKRDSEGAVGAYWGVYNADRQTKFPFTGVVMEVPEWRLLAGGSIVLAMVTFGLLLIDGSALSRRGRFFLAIVASGTASMLVWIAYDYGTQYSTAFSLIVGLFLALSVIGVLLVLFVEAHEMAEAIWVTERRRPFQGVTAQNAYRPKVSVHVPCYNEPPEMVQETLDALAALDYPDYEVLIIDNNTKDPAVWQPVEAHCQRLNQKLGQPRFRFFHVSPISGFKAGALNFGLRQTAPDAEIVAVIDSDYCVNPNWLKELVPHFGEPNIAVVQGPQDYRDGGESLFKRLCYAEYKGFFHIGMVTRNDRNAIIQHGTMTMIRRSVLEKIGWAEWCITEDAELGLRVFEEGYQAAYVEHSQGRGVMPDTFIDFKKQRYRWAYGAIQIMRRHTDSLLRGKGTKLSWGQRYHFIGGWLPWIADGMNLFFTAGALLWASMMILMPQRIDPPMFVFALPPVTLFFGKLFKLVYLYHRRVGTRPADTLAAAVAGLSLSHTIAKAVLMGLCRFPFFRTPKLKRPDGLLAGIANAREEVTLLLLLWLAAFGIQAVQAEPSTEVSLWSAVLMIQSLPYLAALIMSIISVMPAPANPEPKASAA